MNDAGRAYMNFGVFREGSPVEKVLNIEDGFNAYLDAAINSSSAKVIAQPTVLVLEGQRVKVEAATEVATSISTEEGDGESVRSKLRSPMQV